MTENSRKERREIRRKEERSRKERREERGEREANNYRANFSDKCFFQYWQ